MTNKIAFRCRNIVFGDQIKDGTLLIADGKIVSLEAPGAFFESYRVVDCGHHWLMPGLADVHVHINEPGRTEWEGFETATRAAAAGGVTTLVEMPLNASPVTTTKAHFETKLEATKGKLTVDCGFWGGVVPGNLHALDGLLERGVFGLKAFLTHSGIDEFPNATEADLRQALHILKKYDRPLLVHCELETQNPEAWRLEQNPTSYLAYLASRPKKWENDAIELMIRLCRETGGRVHIVHVSSAEALPAIRKAKDEGIPLTAETCPQYLFTSAEEIEDGDTRWKCAPPIRERANNELLWEALADGTLDFVASDHSPAPPEIKEIASGNFRMAWGGIAGLQFSLPVLWTAARKRGFSPQHMAAWLSRNPTQLPGLQEKKGQILPGYHADLLVWNPDAQTTITPESILHRHKISPYAGLTLRGTVEQTWLRGRCIYGEAGVSTLQTGEVLFP